VEGVRVHRPIEIDGGGQQQSGLSASGGVEAESLEEAGGVGN
jgi:hypothetical protein